MSEYVKKTVMGYKEVPGGYYDREYTHVILTREEYEKQLREISDAKQEALDTRYAAERKIQEIKNDATYEINQSQQQVDKIQKELEAEQRESALQRGLNENLLRIAKERANADRELKPKKGHTGYVVMASGEKEQRRKERNRSQYYYIKQWETVLQTPYSIEFTEEQARHLIEEDLMQGKNSENWFLARLGIYEKPKQALNDMNYEDDEEPADRDPQRDNVLIRYRLRANYQTRRDEEVGFWEIVLIHKNALRQVPKDMRVGN